MDKTLYPTDLNHIHTAARINTAASYAGVAICAGFELFGPMSSAYSLTVWTWVGFIGIILLNLNLVIFKLPNIRAAFPRLYGFGMLLIVPSIIMNLATIDLIMSKAIPNSFSQHLTSIDALYFAVTTFATVGYGDISPTSEPARVLVIFQIAVGFIITGFVLVKVTSNRQSRQTK